MFGSLFEEEEETPLDITTGIKQSGVSKLQCPPDPRGTTRICGLQNQGATCYLNSLLQTLFFTPEFRDGIFKLRAEDLGYNSRKDTSSKVRVIPLNLQKLFAKLLLLDKNSISTSDLTDSFGWTGNEGFQQHDVQELNRIFFSALESSLVGTPGEALIRKLYHGTSVTKVICNECGHVSEREEDYLDLPLILSGCSGLEQSLSMSYVAMETLEGANQYKCSLCDKHVNASKGSKIRTLPPILTFSLLRFDYDFQRGERFKETKRYSFPVSLNMDKFCESSCGVQDQDYELFSVVIHGGSCYGGHYHAYIHDVEGLGTWCAPDKEQVRIAHEDGNGEDIISCGHPVELVSTLLKKLGGAASVNQLCQCMSKEAGISWNKRFKTQYGPLRKFFKRHSDVFTFNDSCGWVSLKKAAENSGSNETQDEHRSLGDDFTGKCSQTDEAKRLKFTGETIPEAGHCWFDVNDSRISCIHERDIQHQFAGKESAYMLFYRRKNLLLSRDDPFMSIPTVLRAEVEEMNKQLTKQRVDYDVRLNQISVSVHFGNHFTMADGILMLRQGLSAEPLVVSMDRRKSVTDLLQTVVKLDSFKDNAACKTLHIARRLPAGLHLFEELTRHPEKSLVQSGVNDGTEVFLWNGKEVDGCKVYPGEDTVPVLLNITYALSQDQETAEIQKIFRKDTTVGEMKLMLSNSFGINYQDLLLSWVKSKGKSSDVVLLNSDHDGDTLNEICLQDGDHLVAEKRDQTNVQSAATLASQESEKHANTMSFLVENRCVVTETQEEEENSSSWPVFPVEILNEQTIGDLKKKVLQTQCGCRTNPEIGCRLRVDDDFQGLSPPLYDHETVGDSWLKQGQKLVLEPGAPLLQSEIMIRYYVCSSTHTREEMEQIVDKKLTVRECLQLLMTNTKLEGMTWHLRKTNWIGEPANVLDNEDETLGNENIKNGDTLIIEEGRLPPKGFIRLSLWQTNSTKTHEQSSEDVLSRIASGVQGLLGSDSTTDNPENVEENSEITGLAPVGDIEISQGASLYDLKLQISTMSQLADHVIPTPGFIRLQEVVDSKPTRVLRGTNRTLRFFFSLFLLII